VSGPKHTPGPWRFYQEPMQAGTEWHVITNEHRTRVIANVPVEPGNAMDEANAHLIAAAPRLAEELSDLVKHLEEHDPQGDVQAWLRSLLDYHLSQARTALREAGVS